YVTAGAIAAEVSLFASRAINHEELAIYLKLLLRRRGVDANIAVAAAMNKGEGRSLQLHVVVHPILANMHKIAIPELDELRIASDLIGAYMDGAAGSGRIMHVQGAARVQIDAPCRVNLKAI